MNKLLFGIAGVPIGEGKKLTYISGIEYLKQIGLDAMELEFVRGVNVTDKNKEDILNMKLSNDFYLSAHGSYFINLNAEETEKKEKSIERILSCSEGIKKVNGTELIFHPGFYLKSSKEETYNSIKEQLLKLPSNGVNYRLETTGKPTQFGSLEENVSLCKEIKTCKLCIDFSHLHARYNGALKNYEDFVKILQYVEKELGREALDDMHIHMSGIQYSEKGEKCHLPLEESDFNYKACIKALKDFSVKGCIICESPLLEQDALKLKEYYNSEI